MHSTNPLRGANILKPEQGCSNPLYPVEFHKNNLQQPLYCKLPPPICLIV